MKALVDATPISGPARVGSTISASLAIVLSGTLTTAMTFCILSFANLNAASVSAVSPDCEINTATPFSGSGGILYLNSDAVSMSTGIPARLSIQ